MHPNFRFFVFILIFMGFWGCQQQSLVKNLLSDNPDTRGKALISLSSLPAHQKDKTVFVLIDKLTDPNTQIVNRTVDALSVLGPAAVPALKTALTKKDPFARMSSAQALGLIGDGAATAVDDLAALLKDEHPLVRDEAATSLGHIGEAAKKAVPALIEALDDENEDVRLSAQDALQKLGTKEALQAIKKLEKPI